MHGTWAPRHESGPRVGGHACQHFCGLAVSLGRMGSRSTLCRESGIRNLLERVPCWPAFAEQGEGDIHVIAWRLLPRRSGEIIGTGNRRRARPRRPLPPGPEETLLGGLRDRAYSGRRPLWILLRGPRGGGRCEAGECQ